VNKEFDARFDAMMDAGQCPADAPLAQYAHGGKPEGGMADAAISDVRHATVFGTAFFITYWDHEANCIATRDITAKIAQAEKRGDIGKATD